MLQRRLIRFAAGVLTTLCAVSSFAGPTSQPSSTAFDPGDLSFDGPGSKADAAPELMLFKALPVVVAAGKREQTQREAAASVSVVTADDIDLFGYRSIADVLRGQRSFYLHTDGLNWFGGVRGFLRPGEWNARILLLVDGRPTRETIFGQTHIDQDFVVPIEAVDRVEVIRGPGSSLYGTNAVFGIINVVTKTGAEVNGFQVKGQAGTQDTGRFSALYGTQTRDGWDMLAAFGGFTTQGASDIIYDGVHDAAHGFGHIRDFGGESADDLFLKLHKGDFTAEFSYASREKQNQAATYLTSWSDPGAMHEDRGSASFRIDHEVSPGQSFHAMAYYGHYNYRQQFMYDADPTANLPADQYVTQANDDWIGAEVNYDWQITRSLHLLAGAEGTDALYTHQRDHDSLNGTVLNVNKTYNSWGVFAQGEWKATNWLTIVTGSRVDNVQRVGTFVSPRAAAIITPTREDTFKLLYGRAFRAPNLYEMFYGQQGFNTPNPALRPEIVDTYELVYERQFQDGWRTTLDGFIWEMGHAMENVILADGSLQTQNGGRVTAPGIEAEIGKSFACGATLRAYGTFTHARDSAGDRLTNSPEWIVGTSLAVPVWKKTTFLAIEPQIVGPMKIDTGKSVDATFVTNVILTSREFAKVRGLELQLGLYDLFGNSARFPRNSATDQFQQTLNWPRTTFLASLTYRF